MTMLHAAAAQGWIGRTARAWIALTAAVALGGCAGLAGPPQLSAEVASFGEWAPARKPGTYAFERLPSQQARADVQQQLEQAAAPALAAVGFEPVSPGAEPEFVVQLGARATRYEPTPWNDPLWWRGSPLGWPSAPWVGWRRASLGLPGWPGYWRQDGMRVPLVEREVAVLIRERRSGAPLYEARAVTDAGYTGSAARQGLFNAALKDFPATGLNPRSVTVELPRPSLAP